MVGAVKTSFVISHKIANAFNSNFDLTASDNLKSWKMKQE